LFAFAFYPLPGTLLLAGAPDISKSIVNEFSQISATKCAITDKRTDADASCVIEAGAQSEAFAAETAFSVVAVGVDARTFFTLVYV